MATEVLELQIRVSGAAQGTGAFKSLQTGAQAANKSIVDMSNSLRFMRNVLVGLSFARVFEGLEAGITAAQSSLNLLRTVTSNGQQAGAAFDHFYKIAQQTRTPMEDIVKLATQVSRTIADSPDKLRIVDSVTKNIAESFAVAGANGQTVRNVIRDLIEMFSGGTVIMRQFRAILQQDRPLIDSIAATVKATGPGAAKFNSILDHARAAGNLSGGTLVEALQTVKGALQGSDVQKALSQDTNVTKQFALTTETLGQSLTKLGNSWQAFLEHVNDATNSLNFLSKAVDFVGDHIPLIVLFVGALAGMLIIDVIFKAFANFGNLLTFIFNTILAPIKLVGSALLGLISPLLSIGAAVFRGLFALPDLFIRAGQTGLEFSRAVFSIASGFAELVSHAPIAILNGITTLLSNLAASAGITVRTVSLFAETAAFGIKEAFVDLTSVFGDIVRGAGGVGAAFVQLGSQALSAVGGVVLSAFASLLEAVLALGPALIALVISGLGIAAVGVAIYGLLRPLGQVGTAVGELGISWGTLPSVVLATVEVIVREFPLFTQTIVALWHDMLNSMKNDLGNFGNEVLHAFADPLGILGKFGHNITAAFGTGLPTNSAAPFLNHLVSDIKTQIPIAQAQIKKIVGPFMDQFFQLINGTGPGEPAKPKTKYTQGAFDSAKQGLDALIAKLEPAAAATARLAEVQKVFDKAAHVGIDVDAELAKFSLTRSEVMRREARDAVGAGNADTDFAGKARLLDATLKAGSITLEEHDRLLRQAQETQLKTKFDVGSGVQLAFLEQQDRELNRNAVAANAVNEAFSKLDAARDYQTTVEALNLALAKNKNLQDGVNEALYQAHLKFLQTKTDIGSGEESAFLQHEHLLLDQNKTAVDALNAAFARQDAANKFLVGTKAINDALAQQKLSAKDAADAVRELQIEYLNTQTDALSGFQRGLLESQKSMNDFAATASKTVTDAFNDMTDALTKFFDTGKFDFSTLLTDLQTNLTKLAVQQTITGPLSNLLGFNQSGGGGLFGNGGPLASLFGGTGLGGLAGGQLGTQTNPMYVKFADATGLLGGIGGGSGSAGGLFGSGGIFSSGGFFSNLFSGAGGGAGSTSSGILSFFSSLFGAATGADFMVGGDSGATDSQLVAFRATRGERVTVQTPQQQRGGGYGNSSEAPVQELHLHLHGVTDFDSFKKSKSQVATGFAGLAARAQRRNNG